MGSKLSDYWPFVPDFIHSYGFAMMVGFLAALFAAHRRAKKIGLPTDAVMDLAFWAFLSGLIGARLFYVFQNLPGYLRAPWEVFFLWEGGLVFYGGLLTATAVSFYTIYVKKLPLWRTLDVFASVVMVGLAFGRIGCFSRGCCWGIPTEAWWGVVFPPDAPPYVGTGISDDTALVPTQLISSFNAFVIFGITSLYWHRWRRRDGEVVVLLFILYPIHRFIIEFFRADTHVPGSLTVAQWISIACFFLSTGLLIWLRSRPSSAATPEANAPPPEEPANRKNRRPKGKRSKRKRGKQKA